MPLDIESEGFWKEPELAAELRRVSDICNGCRRCYNLCPSFQDLFERLDSEGVDGDAEKLAAADFRSVTDLCFQCKLCFNHCPYTPPHRWNIDFPWLMTRSKAVETRRSGISLQDRFLGRVDTIGRLASRLAPLVNWSLRNPIARRAMEKLFGIHRDRLLPAYAAETFERWFARRRAPGTAQTQVGFFYTCTANYHEPAVARACVRVLEKNGVGVICPPQRCCGMPFLDGGDVASARRNAEANVGALAPLVEKGVDVVVPGPTCSYMLKREYPRLVAGGKAERVAARTFDICEYLMARRSEGKLATDFVRPAGRVAYQIPCHLRAQNIGFKSRDLMQLIPGTTVHLIERCSAIDGTWGLKRQYFDLSLKVAQPLLQELGSATADVIASDCLLAGLQIQQGTGKKPLHPIQILEQAYGLRAEEEAR